MSQESQSATIEPETIVRSRKNPKQADPKRLPPYAVVVLDDDLHTFDYVIQTFMKVFGYPKPKCFQLANTVHTQGRAVVWTGPKEVAELKRDQILGAGPDFHAGEKIDFPLGVVIEPLPGG